MYLSEKQSHNHYFPGPNVVVAFAASFPGSQPRPSVRDPGKTMLCFRRQRHLCTAGGWQVYDTSVQLVDERYATPLCTWWMTGTRHLCAVSGWQVRDTSVQLVDDRYATPLATWWMTGTRHLCIASGWQVRDTSVHLVDDRYATPLYSWYSGWRVRDTSVRPVEDRYTAPLYAWWITGTLHQICTI